jgi:hypothetical protein
MTSKIMDWHFVYSRGELVQEYGYLPPPLPIPHALDNWRMDTVKEGCKGSCHLFCGAKPDDRCKKITAVFMSIIFITGIILTCIGKEYLLIPEVLSISVPITWVEWNCMKYFCCPNITCCEKSEEQRQLTQSMIV